MSPAKQGDHGQIGDLLLAHDDLAHTGGNGIADAFDSGISHKTYFLLVCLLQYTIGGKEMQEERTGQTQVSLEILKNLSFLSKERFFK
jgi:hypothetical protein